MSTKIKEDTVYVLTGEAKDQETIIRQRKWYEDEVAKFREFASTKLIWNMNKKGNFAFQIFFYA
jgi:hypothetical protein